MSRIAVLGSGAWGTALALSLASQSRHHVTLWSHRRETADTLAADRENRRFLPGFPFPAPLAVTSCDAQLVDAEILVCAVPSGFLRPTISRLAPHFSPGASIVSTTKGIEDQTCLRMSQVIAECLSQVLGGKSHSYGIAALSGPSFAQEVAAGQPTAVTIASSTPEVASRMQQAFTSPTLRLYTSDDLIGVELGGALKNVIAIATGVVSGLGLGSNSAAALITRGMAEITRLAVAAGGRRETLAGLSGIGDLILTCTGSLSRNRSVGQQLGQGHRLADILAGLNGKVAEGVHTTTAALGFAHRLGVDMPITSQMAQILHQNKSPQSAIRDLMQRPARDEED
jgi:glycerol-3-phosphate dehydrogenase (NAD(P)+)